MPACEVILGEGSPLSPEPILKVFGNVPHQLGEFHVIKELTKALPRAVAKLCKELAATKPKLGRGRHATPAACTCWPRRRMQSKRWRSTIRACGMDFAPPGSKDV